MYPVTQDFLEKVRADERRVYGRAVIDYTDPFLDQSIAVTVSEQANVSYPQQTADAVTEPYAKYAAFDSAWVLGQDWALAPGPIELKQMGYWGSQLAGTGGAFVKPYPTLTVAHFARPIHSLTVSGDSKRGEWPVDFSIKLYGEGNVLLHTETVTGNTGIHWSKPLSPVVTGIVKQELVITRWSHEGRQVKILEFFTSIQQTYDIDDLMEISLLEEREVGTGTIPLGAISANEITIRLRNDDRRFDAGNTLSPVHGLLKPNRRVRAWLGAEAENNYSKNPPTFSRGSVAYLSDGTQVAANVPRFEAGKFSSSVMVEEGTTNNALNNRFADTSNWAFATNGGGTFTVASNWGKITKGTGTFTFIRQTRVATIPASLAQTFSMTFKNNVVGQAGIRIELLRADGSVITELRNLITFDNSGGTKRVSVTVSAAEEAARTYVDVILGTTYGHNPPADFVEFSYAQLETKPYATSFIGDTRAPELLTIPTPGVLNPQEGTVEFWWNPINQPASTIGPQFAAPPIAQVGNYFQNNSWILWGGVFGVLLLLARGDNATGWTGWWTIIPNLDWYQLNRWYHIVVRWENADTFWVFIDGVRYGPYVSSLPFTGIAGDIMSLGRRDAESGPSNALFDDLRISNRARTDAEILTGYESGLPLPVD